jgi:single-strand DNA-binding protein
MGFLGSDPETRYTQNGTLNVRFSVAVSPQRRRNDTEEPKPVWYVVTAWDRNAETLDKLTQQGYVAKGRPLYVEGKLEPRQYQANDGSMRWSFDVRMTSWEFVTSSPRDQQDQAGQGGQDQGYSNRGNASASAGNQSNSGNQGGNFDDEGPSSMDDVPF